MKKSIWITLVVAAALVAAGIAVTAVGLLLGGKLTAEAYAPVTYTPAGDFTSVYIQGGSAGLSIRPVGEDGTSKTTVVADEREHLTYDVEVRDGALHITVRDERAWYEHIGIFWSNTPAVTLYLPADAYGTLSVAQDAGSIQGDLAGFSFDRMEVRTTSGRIRLENVQGGDLSIRAESGGIRLATITADTIDVHASSGKIEVDTAKTSATFSAKASSGAVHINQVTASAISATASSGAVRVSSATADTLDARASSGKLELTSVTVSASLSAKTTSGAIHITHATASSVGAAATSGLVDLADVIAAEEMAVETESGAIRLDACDGGTITLVTRSGSIRGTLLTQKCFYATSNSGSVRVPDFVQDAPPCRAHTSSGSIKLEVLE